MRDSKRIVFTTWGSFGDIHPFMALALEMQARGHRPAIATLELYREKIEAAGIDFYSMRPDTPAPETEEAAEMMRRVMDLRNVCAARGGSYGSEVDFSRAFACFVAVDV